MDTVQIPVGEDVFEARVAGPEGGELAGEVGSDQSTRSSCIDVFRSDEAADTFTLEHVAAAG